jgi:tetratricopeptide (TPR) repeat protein
MSTQWLLWIVLSALTGSPVLSAVVLLAAWWLGDRFTFRLLPDPLRLAGRWRRMAQLRATLHVNPNDRRARFELAERLLETGRPARAAEVLRPNVEAGDEDARTAFVMGAALGRSGAPEQAERALAVAREQDPRFRSGEIDLELGRQRLARGDHAGAREALLRLVAERPGTVEGRSLLARALAGLGDAAGARAVRDQAWAEYAALPRFHRRHERPFAWRMKPWRPAAVALVVLVVLGLGWGACGRGARRADRPAATPTTEDL